MKNALTLITTALFFLIFGSCGGNKDKLLGKWERFDDESSGSVIEISKVGSYMEGKLTHPSGNLVEQRFEPGDIKWKEIVPDTKEKKRYSGKDLFKRLDAENNVKEAEYMDIYFEFLSNDIIQILDPSGSQGGINKPQKWRRIN